MNRNGLTKRYDQLTAQERLTWMIAAGRRDDARLTATRADVLLQAIGVRVLGKPLEALPAVLLGRKDKRR